MTGHFDADGRLVNADDQAVDVEEAGAREAELSVEPTDQVGSAPAPSPPAPGIAYNERVLCLGMTGSGKSELLNHLFSVVRCQRLLVDTKDEFTVPGVEPVSDPDAIDWSLPVIHYVDATSSPDEFDRLFAACYRRRHLVVAAHELGDLCAFRPNATPPGVMGYLNKGRSHGLGLLGGSQRPVLMPTHARSEAAHVFIFAPALDGDDHDAIAKTVGMNPRELRAAIDQLHAELGDHAFLWWNRKTRELVECAPLPDHVRARTVVSRRTVA